MLHGLSKTGLVLATVLSTVLAAAAPARAEFNGYIATGIQGGNPNFTDSGTGVFGRLGYDFSHSLDAADGTLDLFAGGVVQGSGREDRAINETQALREAYAEYQAGSFTLGAGRRVHVQGVADGFIPTDAVSPRNFRFAVYEEQGNRFGSDGVWGTLFLGSDVTVSAYAHTNARSSVLPRGIYPGALSLPDKPVEGGGRAYGGRITWAAGFGDLGISLHSGPANLPYLSAAGTGVQPVVPHLFMAGADFDLVRGAWRFYGEAALHEYKSGSFAIPAALLPENELQAVLGAERELAGTSRLAAQLFFRDLRTARSTGAGPLAPLAAGVRTVYGQHEDRQTGSSLSYTWESGDTRRSAEATVSSWFEDDLYVRLRGKYRLGAQSVIYLYADWLEGPAGSPYGTLEESSNIGLEYRIFF
ncbi:hypothetical protein [Leisingera thetidis]|uniref:hypothetical protein n=1 Tax=Leisingera thetidis TaxID=2930199 RepID=UPI0021F6CA65|nr:hypothetical protein [Leisingera thetidis]